jgi:hypothetical protein
MAVDSRLIVRPGARHTPSAVAGLAGEASGQSGPDLAEPGQIRPAQPFLFFVIFPVKSIH